MSIFARALFAEKTSIRFKLEFFTVDVVVNMPPNWNDPITVAINRCIYLKLQILATDSVMLGPDSSCRSIRGNVLVI